MRGDPSGEKGHGKVGRKTHDVVSHPKWKMKGLKDVVTRHVVTREKRRAYGLTCKNDIVRKMFCRIFMKVIIWDFCDSKVIGHFAS